jgi:DNA-binding response OmpR family regulator
VHRILLVDDEPAIRELVENILSPDEYEVFHAEDGAEALDVVRAKAPDLVVLDLMMPMMNGIETCRQIKQEPSTAETSVLMLTARTDYDSRVDSEEAQADAYLTKPFSPFTLLKMIEHLLEVAEKRRT